MSRSKGQFAHLDMLRGLAALGVVVGHARGFIVVQYAVAPSDALSAQLFYFITSLGHQCVLAFFALSGYLVGGGALRNIRDGDWCLSQYMLRRLVRLWTVLVPALLLTWILDVGGQIVAGPAGYNGAYFDLIASGPQKSNPADLSLLTFVANIMFLQTIITPVFGSNGPLWSLANEFWYYVIFPLIAQALVGRGAATSRVLQGCIGVAVAMLLPLEMLLLGGIWVAGAVAGYFTDRLARHLISGAWLILFVGVIAAFLVLNKLWPGLLSDLLLGLAFAALLPVLTLLPQFGIAYDRIGGGVAAISYTLYATHFPLLTFVWFVALAPDKWPLGLAAMCLMAAFLSAALAVATAMWWLFERNTDRFRGQLEAWLTFGGPRSPQGKAWG